MIYLFLSCGDEITKEWCSCFIYKENPANGQHIYDQSESTWVEYELWYDKVKEANHSLDQASLDIRNCFIIGKYSSLMLCSGGKCADLRLEIDNDPHGLVWEEGRGGVGVRWKLYLTGYAENAEGMMLLPLSVINIYESWLAYLLNSRIFF